MAIAKNIILNSLNMEGIQIPKAYHVIIDMKGNSPITITLGVFWDRDSYKNNKKVLNTENFEFTPDYSDGAENLKKQFYNYLLTLDNYKDAQIILEEGQVA